MANKLQFATLNLRPLLGPNSLMSDAEFLSNLQEEELIEVGNDGYLALREVPSFVEKCKGTEEKDARLKRFLLTLISSFEQTFQNEVNSDLSSKVHSLEDQDFQIIIGAYEGLIRLAFSYYNRYTPQTKMDILGRRIWTGYYVKKMNTAECIFTLSMFYREKVLRNQLGIPILTPKPSNKGNETEPTIETPETYIVQVQGIDKRVEQVRKTIIGR